MLDINKIHKVNALEGLKQLDDNSIDCVMTSPPYWALRDYGIKGQLGLESTFDEYIDKLCNIFDEVKRVMKKEGTCWVNLGDTYGGSGMGLDYSGHTKGPNSILPNDLTYMPKVGHSRGQYDKSLLMIPSRFAIEMINRGWILRNTIIWHKPNCMPSSAKDRFTVDFEYLFFFVKNKKYYFEAQYEPIKEETITRAKNSFEGSRKIRDHPSGHGNTWNNNQIYNSLGRNKRTVWSISPQPFPEAHFAVYPEKLCEAPIKSGCPEFICKKCGKARERIIEQGELTSPYKKQTNIKFNDRDIQDKGWNKESGFAPNAFYKKNLKGYTNCNCNSEFESGIVLDPFMGAGTTALTALKLNRRFIGFEIKQDYIDIANKIIKPYLDQTKLEGWDSPDKNIDKEIDEIETTIK